MAQQTPAQIAAAITASAKTMTSAAAIATSLASSLTAAATNLNTLASEVASLSPTKTTTPPPVTTTPPPVVTSGGPTVKALAIPAAIQAKGWNKVKGWTFGTTNGTVKQYTDFVQDKSKTADPDHWGANSGAINNSNEDETFDLSNFTDTQPCFVPQPNWCDIVAVYDGGPIVNGAANGSIMSLQLDYNVSDAGFKTATGAFGARVMVSKVSGPWSAFWMIGHIPGQPNYQTNWGPEYDIQETNGTATQAVNVTIHGNGSLNSQCFLPAGGAPAGFGDAPGAVYSNAGFTGGQSWSLGSVVYTPSPAIDYAADFHDYFCMIDETFMASFFVDGIQIAHFNATQYASDLGVPVTPRLILDLAMGGDGGVINTADFGGTNYNGPNNKMRYSIMEVAILGPVPAIS